MKIRNIIHSRSYLSLVKKTMFLFLVLLILIMPGHTLAQTEQPPQNDQGGTPIQPIEIIDPAIQTPDAPQDPNAPLAGVNLFGVEMYPMTNEGGLSFITVTNTKFVRGPTALWSDFEATKGVYDWSALTALEADITNAKSVPGAEVIIQVRGVPAWAQPPTVNKKCGPIYATYYDEFAVFIDNLMIELINDGFTTLNYWEIWNEPDVPWSVATSDSLYGCWGDSSDPTYYGGDEFGLMLRQVYPKIKTRNANAKVIVGGLALDCDPRNPPDDPGNPGNKKNCDSSYFLKGILAADVSAYFDGIAIHAYDYYDGVRGHYSNTNWPGSAWNQEGPSMVQKARYVRSLLSQYGVTGKFIINSENSLLGPNRLITDPYQDGDPPSFPTASDNEKTKAYYVAQAYANAIYQGLTANIWYDNTGTWLRNNGLLKLNPPSYPNKPDARLPAYDAYEWAAYELSGTVSVRKVIEFPGITGFEFDKGGGAGGFHVWLLWSLDGNNHTIVSPFDPQATYDVFGEPKTNLKTITVTLEPVYLELPATFPRTAVPISWNNYPFNYLVTTFDTSLTACNIQDCKITPYNVGLPVSWQQTHPPNPTAPGTLDPYVPLNTGSALLGGINYPCDQVPANGYARLDVQFTIPNITIHPMWMLYNYVIYSQDFWDRNDTVRQYDNFEVYITDLGDPAAPTNPPPPAELKYQDGNEVNNLGCKWWRVPSQVPENIRMQYYPGWALGWFDLSPYAGHLVVITFVNVNRYGTPPNTADNYFNTYTYLDNIIFRIGPMP